MTRGPEEVFQSQVLALAKLYGWRRNHQRAAYQPGAGRWLTATSGEPGFPDLVLVRGERLIFAELKSAKGRLTMTQVDWLTALELVPGVEVYTWRPKDLDEIHQILKR